MLRPRRHIAEQLGKRLTSDGATSLLQMTDELRAVNRASGPVGPAEPRDTSHLGGKLLALGFSVVELYQHRGLCDEVCLSNDQHFQRLSFA